MNLYARNITLNAANSVTIAGHITSYSGITTNSNNTFNGGTLSNGLISYGSFNPDSSLLTDNTLVPKSYVDRTIANGADLQTVLENGSSVTGIRDIKIQGVFTKTLNDISDFDVAVFNGTFSGYPNNLVIRQLYSSSGNKNISDIIYQADNTDKGEIVLSINGINTNVIFQFSEELYNSQGDGGYYIAPLQPFNAQVVGFNKIVQSKTNIALDVDNFTIKHNGLSSDKPLLGGTFGFNSGNFSLGTSNGISMGTGGGVSIGWNGGGFYGNNNGGNISWGAGGTINADNNSGLSLSGNAGGVYISGSSAGVQIHGNNKGVKMFGEGGSIEFESGNGDIKFNTATRDSIPVIINPNFKGIVLSEDVSGNFTANSLVTKKYVDEIVANGGIPPVSENEISFTARNFKLISTATDVGGPINTFIGNDYTIGGAGLTISKYGASLNSGNYDNTVACSLVSSGGSITATPYGVNITSGINKLIQLTSDGGIYLNPGLGFGAQTLTNKPIAYQSDLTSELQSYSLIPKNYADATYVLKNNPAFTGILTIPSASANTTGTIWLTRNASTGVVESTLPGYALSTGLSTGVSSVTPAASATLVTNMSRTWGNIIAMRSYAAKTASYTLAATDDVIDFTAATNSTATLPTAASIAGEKLFITNSGAGVVTMAATSGQTIASLPASSYTLSQGGVLIVASDGANWKVLSYYNPAAKSGMLNITANTILTASGFGPNGQLDIYANAATAPITITLPGVAAMAGYQVNIIKTDASSNAVTIQGAGGININQLNTYSLPSLNSNVSIKSNSTQYWLF